MRLAILVASYCFILAACGGGEGSVTVTAYGEEFIEQGIQATDMADGWTVEFTQFRATISDINVAGEVLAAPPPVDVKPSSGGTGHVLGTVTTPAGDHSGSAYTISRLEVAGSATKDTVTKSFNWVFEKTTRYSNCEATTMVEDQGQATFQITLHADHLFYDSLVAEEPNVVFQALADADADSDGTLTQAELQSASVGAYDSGSDGSINDLWAYLEALTQTVGHVDGEGHCDASNI